MISTPAVRSKPPQKPQHRGPSKSARAGLIARIERSFRSHWNDPECGNLLYGGARTVAEALEWLDGARGEFSDSADRD